MSHTLTLSDLTVSYNRIPAIHHVSVSLHCGRSVALIGPNGAGKTTLLKAIAGLVPLETGRVEIGSHGSGPESRAVAYVPQRERVDWDFPITVRGLVEMGRFVNVGVFGRFTPRDAAVVDEALAVCDLADLQDRQISALSGGQQQRTFLARAWAQQAHVYLLDEPFTGLDQNASAAFAAALKRLRDAGKLVIASHHNLGNVSELFDDVLILNGELVASGPVDSTFTPEAIERAYRTHVFSGHRA